MYPICSIISKLMEFTLSADPLANCLLPARVFVPSFCSRIFAEEKAQVEECIKRGKDSYEESLQRAMSAEVSQEPSYHTDIAVPLWKLPQQEG